MNWIVSGGGYGSGYIKEDHSDYENAVLDAVEVVKYPPFYDLVKTRLDKYTKGSDVYNFALPDSTGQLVELRQFKGKVLLLDVWATGCIPCSAFFKRFEKEIEPLYKGDTSFHVVSISLDKSEERWKKSVASGLYTNKHHTNLYLAADADNHPFVKYYNLISIPFVLLIDKKGKVIAKLNDPEEFDGANLKSLIDHGLDQ